MSTKKRYCAKMMYLGEGYFGYQRQNEGITIQGSIEDAMQTVFREHVDIIGCGRTDTGVNAKEYYFHFDTSFHRPQSKTYSLNGILGDRIVIQEIFEVDSDFHARYDATLRGYEYHLHTRKNPFLKDSSFYLTLGKQAIDLDKMKVAAEVLIGDKDFFTFCKTHSDVNNTICNVSKSEWVIDGEQWKYVIHGNRFLRGMVRMIVGALVNIGQGKLSIIELQTALRNKERLSTDWSVPAHGLYLYRIDYPQDSLRK